MNKDRQAELALSYVRVARRRLRDYHLGGGMIHPVHLEHMEKMIFNAECLLMPWDKSGHLPDPPLLDQSTMEGSDG